MMLDTGFTMLERVRQSLRRRLKEGFWFPALQKLIGILHQRLCVGNHFIGWLRDDTDNGERKGPVGAAELYVLLTLVIGSVWLGLLGNISVPLLATYPVRLIAAVVAMYRVAEIEIIGLHWVFGAKGGLQSERRSLACFVVNLVEIAVFSRIALWLVGCQSSVTVASALYDSLASVFHLALVAHGVGPACRVIAHAQLFVSVTVVGVVVTNLVGKVAPNEEGQK